MECTHGHSKSWWLTASGMPPHGEFEEHDSEEEDDYPEDEYDSEDRIWRCHGE